ncbi:MAG TPA: N(G),N(G)-dimethylarginine dimethylaminohydrolase [Vicinamibacterales bacterium]|jgi:dimethylargininase
MARLALTREISPAIVRCELTHLTRVPIDLDRARAQHAAYERALASSGCLVERLEAGEEMPDSVFVEDAAIVFDELAIVTRPGAESRRGETAAVAAALQPHRPIVHIEAPGTVDGGDVLAVGRSVFVGRSRRTNAAAVGQIERALAPFGYRVSEVAVEWCLHLKSAATALDDETLLINPDWVPPAAFGGVRTVCVHRLEPAGANILRIGAKLLYAAAFPRTCDALVTRGYHVGTLDVSELAKAEGAVTCCSLIIGG